MLHLDLKPQNIGFTKDGQLKLFDFGLMACVKRRVFSHEAYKMTGGTGTLIYMAPEVTLREAYSEMVDIYSFGMILWQMTSGMTPFVGMRHSDYMEEVVNLGHRPKIPEHLPAPLIQVIERCWQKNPLQRPSCAEILDLLEDASTVSMSMPSLMLCGQIKRFLRSNSAKVADEDTLTQQQNAKLISRI